LKRQNKRATRKSLQGSDEYIRVYKQAIETIPSSLLIRLSFLDHLEANQDLETAKNLYKFCCMDPNSPVSKPLMWIQWMRFAVKSKGIEEGREVFKKARKSPTCTYHVYTAAALNEYYCNKGAEVAKKIFELALRKQPDWVPEPEFTLSYLEFLPHINDDSNIRLLFE